MKQGDRWIIFYEDGSTFCSQDGSPWEAPRDGVLHIAQCLDAKDNDWCFLLGHDQYYYEEDRGGWCEAREITTVMQHLLRARHPCVIFGVMLSHSTWRETHHIVKQYCVAHHDWLTGKTDERPAENYL